MQEQPCPIEEALLSAYLDNQVSESERLEIKQHLATCADCRFKLASLEQIVTLLRTLEPAPVPANRSFLLPLAEPGKEEGGSFAPDAATYSKAVLNRIVLPETPRQKRSFWLRNSWALGTIAALLVVVFLFTFRGGSGTGNSLSGVAGGTSPIYPQSSTTNRGVASTGQSPENAGGGTIPGSAPAVPGAGKGTTGTSQAPIQAPAGTGQQTRQGAAQATATSGAIAHTNDGVTPVIATPPQPAQPRSPSGGNISTAALVVFLVLALIAAALGTWLRWRTRYKRPTEGPTEGRKRQ